MNSSNEIDLLRAENTKLRNALGGMLAEWDKFTRYGSPIAKASNESVQFARAVYSEDTLRKARAT